MTRERNFSAHHKLLGAARAAVKVAEAGQEGWSLSVITAITLCGLAVEAICNAIGDRVVVDLDDFEAAPPKAKLRLLCDKLDVPYDKGREPWGTLMWLLRVRNAIAHAKPELIQEEHHMTREEYEERHYEQPQARLEKELTIKNARKALDAVEELLKQLLPKIAFDKRSGLAGDEWIGTASLLPEPPAR